MNGIREGQFATRNGRGRNDRIITSWTLIIVEESGVKYATVTGDFGGKNNLRNWSLGVPLGKVLQGALEYQCSTVFVRCSPIESEVVNISLFQYRLGSFINVVKQPIEKRRWTLDGAMLLNRFAFGIVRDFLFMKFLEGDDVTRSSCEVLKHFNMHFS